MCVTFFLHNFRSKNYFFFFHLTISGAKLRQNCDLLCFWYVELTYVTNFSLFIFSCLFLGNKLSSDNTMSVKGYWKKISTYIYISFIILKNSHKRSDIDICTMQKIFWLILYSKILLKSGRDFLDTQFFLKIINLNPNSPGGGGWFDQTFFYSK